MRLTISLLLVGLIVPALSCGADSAAEPSEVSEAAAQSLEPEGESVFVFEVSGSIEAEIEGPGDLRCIDMGDSGPGYFVLDNGKKTGTIAFQFPLDATEGSHEVTARAEVLAAQQMGKAYSIDVSLATTGIPPEHEHRGFVDNRGARNATRGAHPRPIRDQDRLDGRVDRG